MNKKLKILIGILIFSSAMTPVSAQTKLAQTGFQFLSVTPDARDAAMAGALTTVENHSSALFSNPAMLAEIHSVFDLMVNQNNWIADIKHNALTGSFQPMDGRFGVIAVGMMFVDYGEIEGTVIANNELGYIETGMVRPSAYLVGLGYGKQLSNKFSIGTQIKLVSQYLGPAIGMIDARGGKSKIVENEESVLAFDFGTVYKTGFKGLAFGMSVRNFSEEIKFAQEGFQLPLTFNIGVSASVLDFMNRSYQDQELLVTADAVHPRSHLEYIRIGTEYRYQNMFSVRLGYVSNSDEENFSYGLGFQTLGISIDYAYTPFGVFDKVQRFSIRFSM